MEMTAEGHNITAYTYAFLIRRHGDFRLDFYMNYINNTLYYRPVPVF